MRTCGDRTARAFCLSLVFLAFRRSQFVAIAQHINSVLIKGLGRVSGVDEARSAIAEDKNC